MLLLPRNMMRMQLSSKLDKSLSSEGALCLKGVAMNNVIDIQAYLQTSLLPTEAFVFVHSRYTDIATCFGRSDITH